jgi:hypothetical protein
MCREIDGIDTPLAYRDDIVAVFPPSTYPPATKAR